MGRKSGGRKGATNRGGAGGAGRQVDVHGNPSAEAIRQVNEAIKNIPTKVWQALDAHGAKAVLAEHLTDVMPHLATVQPRGWPTGATWQNVDGLYSHGKKMALVGERYQQLGGTAELTSHRIPGVFRHELGHAHDDALGGASRRADFMKAYAADVKKMPGADKPMLHYYLQKGEAGPSEAYAEMFGHHFGGGSSYSDVRKSFPRAYKVMKRELK